MATNETPSAVGKPARAWDFLLAGRPLVALAPALFTTSGHTLNLRELGVAQGWVAAEVNALQTCYLVSLALMMITCPALGQRFSCRSLAQSGLALLVAGSFLNGLVIGASLSVFLVGRSLAGIGAALVIYFTPRLFDRRWQIPTTWATIFFPVAGPGIVSSATTLLYETSDWEWGFLFEGSMAVVGLILLLSMSETNELRPVPPRASLSYFPGLVVAIIALLYCLHWGQLHGWLESPDIALASTVSAVALAGSLWIAWPQLDWLALKENWIRFVLFYFGGTCQYLLGSYLMNAYGSSIVNFSSWQRVWLILPMTFGLALSLALSRLRWWQHLLLGLRGAVIGLLSLAGGLYLSLRQTMDWPYWQIRDTVDLNWFEAPQHWELAPGRFLMGLGLGLFMMAMDRLVSPDLEREERVRTFLPVVQFLGGGIASALLINFLLIGHAIHYSYSADRDYIQADEMAQRRSVLRDDLGTEGNPAPDRAVEVLMYRAVNYEADNLVFATIYAAFLAAALVLAGITFSLWLAQRLRAYFRRRSYSNSEG